MKASIHTILPTSVLVALLITAAPTVTAANQDADTLTANHPWIGEPAPEFSLTSTNGSSVALSDYKGKFLVVHFAASW
jgi:cytochrome oxidase Cu insertion factor (SCO1/SenC/PrrC family)